MSNEQFTQQLREFTERRPFIPFEVELVDGRRIVVDHPAVAFGDGVAGFINETDGLVDFSCDEVRRMSYVTAGAAS